MQVIIICSLIKHFLSISIEAHCFHDESEMSAAKLQEKIFQVAAGKTQRNLTVEENRDVQIRNVHKIIMEDA